MPSSDSVDSYDGSLDDRELEERYQELERAWQENAENSDVPVLVQFLPTDPHQRVAAVKLLAPMDLEYRFRHDPATRVELYLEQCPELKQDQPFLRELVAWECELRSERGSVVNAEDYVQRFPELPAASIHELLGAVENDSSDASPPIPQAREDSIATQADELPDRIGRYPVDDILGRGAFGTVYRGFDERLKRYVAIKVPHRRGAESDEVDRFLVEAQLVAGLDHHAIVPIYDFGTSEDGRYFVVSKYIAGENLANLTKSKRANGGRWEFLEAAQIVASVAEALQYAHALKICHRDVKPANMLLDENGHVFLADFGLALTDDGFGSQDSLAGTPLYMSPEQAASEAHLVDGRSDIFSLGAVFYELLCGETHVSGKTLHEVLKKIRFADARPPRQLDHRIPRELERICLKALERQPTDRYTNAGDLAHDLQSFLDAPKPVASKPEVSTPIVSALPQPDESKEQRVIPKGLRSFDEKDRDFFLDLLPGCRNREGLPERIQFWKERIEDTDSNFAFRVGLIYGPSGSGKSSFVRAGLLPLLSQHVNTIYIESTADQTERQLIERLGPEVTGERDRDGLKAALAEIRRGRGLRSGEKVLLVFDQFEQWLHANPIEPTAPLVQALRECDATHLQCLLLVRSDFWMPVTRLYRQLDIPLREGVNSAAIDLFDLAHARKVLHLFGAAYGKLPEGDLTDEQGAFVHDAVEGLADGDRVICVRLALFAEMMRLKEWTKASLDQIGGAEGVGTAFLEETFTRDTAPPLYRSHESAVRQVLKALLPPRGTDIKGKAMAETDLLAASGYQTRTEAFQELLHILDVEVRLITPTVNNGDAVAEGSSGDSEDVPRKRFYQLTHDYLVAPLRDWLTRRERETRRGRAQLLLEERSAAWNTNPHPRQLPSWFEDSRIRLLTRRSSWTDSDRKMMQASQRFHGVRLAGVAVLLLALAGIGYAALMARQNILAQAWVSSLDRVATREVPNIVAELEGYSEQAMPLLREKYEREETSETAKLHAALALLALGDSPIDYVCDQMLEAEPEKFEVIRDTLAAHKSDIIERLWSEIDDADDHAGRRRLRAGAALAKYDPNSDEWAGCAPTLMGDVMDLLARDPAATVFWRGELLPVADQVLPALADMLAEFAPKPSESSVRSLFLYYLNNGGLTARDVLHERVGIIAAAEVDRAGRESTEEIQSDWKDVRADTVNRIEAAQGVLTDRFAFCQSLASQEFEQLKQELEVGGYRAVSVRSYSTGGETKLAIVWTRDGYKSRWVSGDAQQVSVRHEKLSKDGYSPVDVSHWIANENGSEVQYSAVWTDKPFSERRELLVELFRSKLISQSRQKLGQESFTIWGLSQQRTSEVEDIWSAVVSNSADSTMFRLDPSVEYRAVRYSGLMPIDIQLYESQNLRDFSRRFERALNDPPGEPVSEALKTIAWCKAIYYAYRFAPEGYEVELDQAAGYLSLLLHRTSKSSPLRPELTRFRVLLLATLQRAEGCRTFCRQYMEGIEPDESERFYVQVVSEMLLDPDNLRSSRDAVRARVAQGTTASILLKAAQVFCVASRLAESQSNEQSQLYLAEAVELLESAQAAGTVDLRSLFEEPDFERIDLSKIVADNQAVKREYSAIMRADTEFESKSLFDLSPEKHLQESKRLIADGFEPHRVVALECDSSTVIAASVWKRRIVPLDKQLLYSQQQSRLICLLLGLGQVEKALEHLRKQTDTTVASHVISQVSDYGVVPDTLAKCIEAERQPTVLYTLILALGQLPADSLSDDVRSRLMAALMSRYGDAESSAGVRGATQWLMRSWNLTSVLNEWEGQLVEKASSTSQAPLYRTEEGQGPTMVPIPAGSFVMGSPGWEAGRHSLELPRTIQIPRSFRMSVTPVTRGQVLRFLQDQGDDLEKLVAVNSRSATPASRSDTTASQRVGGDELPAVGLSWYDAARYCNWLSEREGLTPCYEPDPTFGRYDDDMRPKSNFMELDGFRLPTEAEWEYACRAGATTSYFSGNDARSLDIFAWYQENSEARTHGVWTKPPNRFGLFSMIGNVQVWCQDRLSRYDIDQSADKGDLTVVRDTDIRATRAGGYGASDSDLRSAARSGDTPFSRNTMTGFRIVQTIPDEESEQD